MTQMSVQITTPYGTIDAEFPEDMRDVVTSDDGTTLVTYNLMSSLLNQAERVTHHEQGHTLIGFEDSDEHDFVIATVRDVIGRQVVELARVSAQDPGMYNLGDVEFSEVDAFDLDDLPFEVTVTDTTGQLYDDHKEA